MRAQSVQEAQGVRRCYCYQEKRQEKRLEKCRAASQTFKLTMN